MSTIGFATLDVIPSLKGAQASLTRQATGPLTAAGRAAGTSYSKAFLAPMAGLFAGAAALSFLKGSFTEAREAATVARQTTAAIKATGGAANVTAGQIDALSQSLSKQVGIDDETIAGAENLLLTFKGVANQVGAGNDIFDQATEAILNVSTAMKTDLNSATLQIGKALNDPIKGMTALSRSGIQFTEQQKAQAKALVESGDLLGAQKIILKELEGQFGGAAEAGHDAFDDLGVAFGNLQESAGGALVPALTTMAKVTTKDVIPALTTAGGAASDAFSAFQSLPGPVKTAAEAFVALRIAGALGLGTALASGVASLSSGLVTLRIRALLTADAFRAASGSGFGATLAGIRAGAAGAAAGLRTLSVALLPVAAITAVVTVWSKFSQGQAEAKQRVDELKESLDEQTGAITDSTEAAAFDALQKSGAIDAAKELGVALGDVSAAALGNADAQARVNAALDDYDKVTAAAGTRAAAQAGATQKQAAAADLLRDAIGGQNSEIDQAVQGWKDQAEFMGKGADATDDAAGAMGAYAGTVDDARTGLAKLKKLEEERALNAIQQRRDEIALRETIRAARDELKDTKGKDGIEATLKDNNGAADDLMSSLIDVADQFNNSVPKVRGAKGAYEELRGKFIDLAEDMGATHDEAKALADQLIKVPKTAPLKFQSEGYQKLVAELAEVEKRANRILAQAANIDPAVGPVVGPRGPKPEPIKNPFAPRGGIDVHGDLVVHAQDINDTKRQLNRLSQQANLGGRP